MYRNKNGEWIISDGELLAIANYIINFQAPIRTVSKLTNISKSTLHKHLHNRMPNIDFKVYEKLQTTFDDNFNVKHINGGNATKQKYSNTSN